MQLVTLTLNYVMITTVTKNGTGECTHLHKAFGIQRMHGY